jgi:rhodanese-related sulfurtransferase
MNLKKLFAISLMPLIMLSCIAQSDSPAPTLEADVSPETVLSLHRGENKVTIIDVRQDWEYAQGHIPGAILIPLNQLPKRVSEIPREGLVVLVCRSGGRSRQAWKLLSQQSSGHLPFDNIHNMIGGMNAWIRAGYEIEICEAGNC